MLGARDRDTAFLEAFEQLGWTNGRNVQIEIRWSEGNDVKARKYTDELIALAPDVILATGSEGATLMLKATQTIPIVFAVVPDPMGSGFVQSLSRPALPQSLLAQSISRPNSSLFSISRPPRLWACLFRRR